MELRGLGCFGFWNSALDMGIGKGIVAWGSARGLENGFGNGLG